MSKQLENVGRLAFREEGAFWTAYFAQLDTMEGALPLGTIRMSIITRSKERRNQFMELMKASFADAAADIVGVLPTWSAERAAPDHERTKK